MKGSGAMRESGSFASLSPTLLARKGRARPAMRPQLPSMAPLEAVPANWQDDLGWNDMGEIADAAGTEADDVPTGGEVVAFDPAAAPAHRPADTVPEVLRQQAAIAGRIAGPAAAGSNHQSAARRSALAEGRRAAFTLRLDAERHLALRLASTITNRSAQAIVTDALDRLIADIPGIAELSEAVRSKR